MPYEILQYDPRMTMKAFATVAVARGQPLELLATGGWRLAVADNCDAVALTSCTLAEAGAQVQEAYITGITHGRIRMIGATWVPGTALYPAGAGAYTATPGVQKVGIPYNSETGVTTTDVFLLHVPIV